MNVINKTGIALAITGLAMGATTTQAANPEDRFSGHYETVACTGSYNANIFVELGIYRSDAPFTASVEAECVDGVGLTMSTEGKAALQEWLSNQCDELVAANLVTISDCDSTDIRDMIVEYIFEPLSPEIPKEWVADWESNWFFRMFSVAWDNTYPVTTFKNTTKTYNMVNFWYERGDLGRPAVSGVIIPNAAGGPLGGCAIVGTGGMTLQHNAEGTALSGTTTNSVAGGCVGLGGTPIGFAVELEATATFAALKN